MTFLIRLVRRWWPLALIVGIPTVWAVTPVDMARAALITQSASVISPLSPAGSSAPSGQPVAAYIREVRTIYTDEFGIRNPDGLAFSSRANMFQVLEALTPGEGVSDITLITMVEDPAGMVRIAAGITGPVNMAFDDKANRLLVLQFPENHLIEILADSDGHLDPTKLAHHDAQQFGLQNPQGMTVDPVSGHLFFLDSAGSRLVRVEPDGDQGFDNAVISAVDLQISSSVDLQGLAIDPTTGNLHLFIPAEQKLVEVTQTGQPVASRDLSGSEIGILQGMVFAASGDRTDDPLQMNLYLADGGGAGGQHKSGRIIELFLNEPAQPAFAALAASIQQTLVQTIDTSQWSPPSPDSAGIVYLPDSNTLLVSDSEVNEMTQTPPIFTGDNLFEATLTGNLIDTLTTIPFSDEPTGVTLNPSNGHLFFSDDDADSVYILDPGLDELYDTPDDVVTSFPTSGFLSNDPEGVAFAIGLGVLFIADGVNKEIYRVDPGSNGLFDGIPPAGDDQVTSFDTSSFGQTDPEGITFNPDTGNLYIVGKPADTLFEVTTGGTLVQAIDISAANAVTPAGLAYAPSSQNPADMHIYIAARGVDNNGDPNENDGKVYEFTLPLSGPMPEMDVQGNGTSIADGDLAPSRADYTDFGNVSVEGSTLTRTFTIQNFGSMDLILTNDPRVVIHGTHPADFILTIDANTPVAAGGQTTFQVTFNPSADGLREARIRIHNNDADETLYTFAVQGTGAPPVFTDVPADYWARDYIEILYTEGYVAGCQSNPLMYCPLRVLNRAESAVFVMRGEYGAIPDPPYPPPSTPSFDDVDPAYWGYGWIESMWTDGFTAGCGTDPLIYCPLRDHTRAEGSVFFLRIKNGVAYNPPPPVGIFADVPLAAWYAGWAEAAYSEGLLPPCQTNPLRFCPDDTLDRSWTAYMMVWAKGGFGYPAPTLVPTSTATPTP